MTRTQEHYKKAEVLMEEMMNMHKTKSISNAEYHMIRQEIDGNIKKQDEIGNIIFAV